MSFEEKPPAAITISSPLWLDGAVLQREVPLRLRGTAPADCSVTVSIGDAVCTTQSNRHGAWRLTIGPLSAGGPYELSVSSDGCTPIVLGDILVGDVWLCSGQSNMEFALRDAEDAPEALSQAENHRLRLLQIPVCIAYEELREVSATSWQHSNAETAAAFSAIAFYFGKHLTDHLGVPIGLVQATRGATPAEAWMSRKALRRSPDFRPILQRHSESLAFFLDQARTFEAQFRRWDAATDLAEREGRPLPGAQPKFIGPRHHWTPAGLYNGMIAPLASFPIRGVIWYQGSAAPERAFQYRKLFRALIRDWRKVWRIDFPFLFVQEAAFGPRREHPSESSWAELREAQQMALAEPNTAMAVALDCGDATDIHPTRKRPVGERLALAARRLVYEEQVAGFSPLFESMSIEGNRIRVRFKNTYGALGTLDGAEPTGFAVSAGCTDFSVGYRGFKWAQARIEGDELVVWSDEVMHPVAVRYAWAQNPRANLCNAAGLPAAPFRSDEYPGLTDNIL